MEYETLRLRLHISKKIKNLYAGSFQSKSNSTRGFDLQEKRNFRIGDDPRAINKVSTIREGRFKISVKKAEKSANIYMLIDRSGSLNFGSEEKTKNDYALGLVAKISGACLGDGNRIRFFAFTNKMEYEGPFVSTQQSMEDEVSSISKLKTSGHQSDLRLPMAEMGKTLEEGGLNKPNLLFIFSDFLLAPNFDKEIRNLSESTDILVFCLRDKTEIKLPCLKGGLTKLVDGETGRVILAKKIKNPLDNVAPILKRYEVDYIEVDASEEEGKNLKKLVDLFEDRRGN